MGPDGWMDEWMDLYTDRYTDPLIVRHTDRQRHK